VGGAKLVRVKRFVPAAKVEGLPAPWTSVASSLQDILPLLLHYPHYNGEGRDVQGKWNSTALLLLMDLFQSVPPMINSSNFHVGVSYLFREHLRPANEFQWQTIDEGLSQSSAREWSATLLVKYTDTEHALTETVNMHAERGYHTTTLRQIVHCRVTSR